MDGEEENVYNLIEKPVEVQRKPPMYRSKYPHDTPPTASTLALTNTSKPGVANLGGDFVHPDYTGSAHKIKKDSATMGTRNMMTTLPPEKSFLKKRDKEMALPPPKKFEYPLSETKKAAVPKRNEKPIMGLTTNKNFIVTNAVENILSTAKKVEPKEASYLHKPDFGKVPDYLSKIKKEISDEYAYINELQEKQQNREGKDMRLLTEEEREVILQGLREKWAELNKRYQAMSFAIPAAKKSANTYPTLDRTKVVKKEQFEAEMDAIEKDIQKFSKKHVFVFNDDFPMQTV